ncbi:MAG: response regulator [Acidobacteriota bacterium]
MPHRVLAVDDDPKILRIIEVILRKEEDYSVSTAQCGEEALRILGAGETDLVVLDVMLPDCDGYSLCSQIKQAEETRHIPVILLTALDGVENKVRGLDVGASDYLVKPFLQKELLARIRSHLRESESARELKTRYSEEKQKAGELSILNRLTTEFNRSLELDDLLNHAAQVISTELDFYRCVIAMNGRTENRLEIRACQLGAEHHDTEKFGTDLSGNVIGWVAEHRRPLIVEDTRSVPHLQPLFADTRSFMTVPLLHVDHILGVVNVESPRPTAYSHNDLTLLSTLAGNLALAIKNAELYSEVKDRSENLRSMVEERTRELEDQKRFMECIIDSLPIGLYVIDRNYSVATWNRKRETGILGISRDRVIGRDIFSVFSRMAHQKLKSEFDQVLTSGIPFETEAISWTSGEKRHFHLRKIPMSMDGSEVTHVITLGEDITDRKRMEESLLTNEKLASLGKLSAGIAHEINNPLAAIAGCVEGLIARSQDPELRKLAAFDDFPDYLKIIDDEIVRCKGIINNLLDFSRTREILQQEVNVNQSLDQTLQLLSHHKEFKKISLIKEYDASEPGVVGNQGELRQVFLAMAINAMDAMTEVGTLTIRTSLEERNDLTYVCIQFQDTGCGISPRDINKIFDPFFTTKPVGKGTGLGLSICYGIVRSHNGFIKVASEVGKGSLFEIFIPRAGESAPAAPSDHSDANGLEPSMILGRGRMSE